MYLLSKNDFYLFNIPLSDQTPAFPVGFDDLCLGVLAFRKALVLAPFSGWTNLWVAFVHQHPIEALGVKATRVFICGFAVALGNLRNVSSIYLYFATRFIHLNNTLKLFKHHFKTYEFILRVITVVTNLVLQH